MSHAGRLHRREADGGERQGLGRPRRWLPTTRPGRSATQRSPPPLASCLPLRSGHGPHHARALPSGSPPCTAPRQPRAARALLLLCPAACRAPSSPSSPGLGSHAREPSRGWSPPSHSHCAHPRPLACADPAKGPWGSMLGESILVPTRLGSALSCWRHARRSPSPHSVPSGTQLRSLTWIPGPQPRD